MYHISLDCTFLDPLKQGSVRFLSLMVRTTWDRVSDVHSLLLVCGDVGSQRKDKYLQREILGIFFSWTWSALPRRSSPQPHMSEASRASINSQCRARLPGPPKHPKYWTLSRHCGYLVSYLGGPGASPSIAQGALDCLRLRGRSRIDSSKT